MRISIGDVRLFVDVEGVGWQAEETALHARPTVVLVHGGPGSNDHSHYKPAFSALANVAQVIYYDHRGNGRSDRSEPDKWNLAQWAQDLKALCDALDIEHPCVVGTSFGGFVVQAYLATYPGHARRAVLCSTSSRLSFARALNVMERLGGTKARDTAERFWCGDDPAAVLDEYVEICCPLYLRAAPAPTDQVAAIASRSYRNLDVMRHFVRRAGEGHSFNLLPLLSNVKCPTLVLAGEDDPITTFEDAQEMVAALPRHLVTFEKFEHCGHPTYADAPLRTFRLIREFVTSTSAL
jgi:pimeloyl-ACP methyl ester carboxylesterase